MKKSFKSLSMASIFLGASLLAACSGDAGSSGENEAGGSASSGETTTLKVAFNQPENHPQFKAMEAFGEKLSERTNGAYDIEMFPNEVLGAQRETIELVQSGTIAMSIVAGSLMENFNEDFAVFNLPYVFDSRNHQMNILNDEAVVGDLYSSVESQGMKVLGAFHSGVRNVYNKEKPVEKPEDLAGMKIRIIESDTNIKMMEAMGGVPTPMGQGEVYTAIQSGVIEGGENNELIYSNLKHAEIAPYYSYTQHLMIPDYLIINSDVMNGMSEEHQEIFKEELEAAIEMEVQLWDEDVNAAMEAAKAAGAQFNEVNTKIFQEAVQPVIDEKLTSDNAKALYEKVREAAE